MDNETNFANTDSKGKPCPICGFPVTNNYCSQCGSKLLFIEEGNSSLDSSRLILREYIVDILIDPLFAFLKTTWLIIIHPYDFFDSLFVRKKTFNDLLPYSLLNRFWGKPYHRILAPMQYYAVTLALALVINALINALEGGKIAETLLLNLLPPLIDQVIVLILGVFLLLFPVLAAFVFDLLTTKEANLSRRRKYEFWLYVFGLYWIFFSIDRIVKLPLIIFVAALKILMPAIESGSLSAGIILVPMVFWGLPVLTAVVFFGKLLIVFAVFLYVIRTFPYVLTELFAVTDSKRVNLYTTFIILIFFLPLGVYASDFYTCLTPMFITIGIALSIYFLSVKQDIQKKSLAVSFWKAPLVLYSLYTVVAGILAFWGTLIVIETILVSQIDFPLTKEFLIDHPISSIIGSYIANACIAVFLVGSIVGLAYFLPRGAKDSSEYGDLHLSISSVIFSIIGITIVGTILALVITYWVKINPQVLTP